MLSTQTICVLSSFNTTTRWCLSSRDSFRFKSSTSLVVGSSCLYAARLSAPSWPTTDPKGIVSQWLAPHRLTEGMKAGRYVVTRTAGHKSGRAVCCPATSLFVPDSPDSSGPSKDEEASYFFRKQLHGVFGRPRLAVFPRPLGCGFTRAFPVALAFTAFHLFLHWLRPPATDGLLSQSELDSVLALRPVNTCLSYSGPVFSVTSSLNSPASDSSRSGFIPFASSSVIRVGGLVGLPRILLFSQPHPWYSQNLPRSRSTQSIPGSDR